MGISLVVLKSNVNIGKILNLVWPIFTKSSAYWFKESLTIKGYKVISNLYTWHLIKCFSVFVYTNMYIGILLNYT